MIAICYLVVDEILVELQLVSAVLLVLFPVVLILLGVVRHPLLLLLLLHLLISAPAVIINLPASKKKLNPQGSPERNIIGVQQRSSKPTCKDYPLPKRGPPSFARQRVY